MNIPKTPEAEASFVAACIYGGAQEGVSLVDANDLSSSVCQQSFIVIADQVICGGDIDVVTLTTRLREKDILDGIGGAAAIAQILDTPAATNLAHAAEAIRNAAARRRLIHICEQTRQMCCATNDLDGAMHFINSQTALISQGLSGSRPVPLRSMSDDMIKLWESQRGRGMVGLKTGFYLLDNLLCGLKDDDLAIIAARPSMGKTALAMKIARNIASTGEPVLMRSIEMSRQALFTRATADIANVGGTRFYNGQIEEQHWRDIVEAVGRLDTLPIYIDDRPMESIAGLQRAIRGFVREHGHSAVIIDYLQYIQGDKADRHDLSVETITRGLKAVARELRIPIVLLSQLNRNLEKRNDKRPILSDLRDSGAIEQDADVIMFIYRDEVYNPDTKEPGVAEILVAKNRNGQTGRVRLSWIAHRATFENLHRANRNDPPNGG